LPLQITGLCEVDSRPGFLKMPPRARTSRAYDRIDEIEAEASRRGRVLRGETNAAREQPLRILREHFGVETT